jgi:hypothetical protein
MNSRNHTPRHPAPRPRGGARAVRMTLLLTLAAALAWPVAQAAAASRPTAATGNASAVGYASADLHGSVNPEGSNTSYYFQYGLTRSYGGQSAIADAGAGTSPVHVSLPVSGLQPLSVYHYRLVAVNAAGATIGPDRTLLTLKVPLSLAILASPNPLPFGGTATVQGTLSGTGNAGRVVTLQANAFPFTAGFQTLGNPEVTSATGSFSFPVLGLQQVTQFRVVTSTMPVVVSPVTTENVAVIIRSHLARTRRRGYARFYGTVTPAEPGAQVGILRTVAGRGVLAGGTVLKAGASPASSSFSRVVRIHRGVYRVLVRVVTGAQVSAYGQPLMIR